MATPETSALKPERKADINVLGAMKRERGGTSEKQRPLIDIIWESVAPNAPNVSKPGFTVALQRYMQSGPHKLLQIGNTVFLMTAVAPGTIEFVTFSKEPLQALVKRYKTAADIVRKMGVRKVFAYSKEPGMQRIAQNIGMPVKIGQGQRMMGNQMMPVYTFEIDLTPQAQAGA